MRKIKTIDDITKDGKVEFGEGYEFVSTTEEADAILMRSTDLHGYKLPEGLLESARLEQPLFTPSTKAELGEHDENISTARAAEILGKDIANQIENIALALAITRAPAKEIEGRVREMSQRLGIEDCLDKYPYQMSGGQQQRCAAARAMVTRPDLVLADEPTGALDSRAAGLLLERLESLNRDLGATILMVTH
ncbi:MAG: ATP-binding cassette domain-containing protein, partial [Collinsella sp.]|nr:ATP-binding cassette domain-containing protein [Collinsella sp.]